VAHASKLPSLFFKRGKFYIDLRKVGLGRPPLRDPKHPGWPQAGKTTDDAEIAERWRFEYVDAIRAGERRLHLGEGASVRQLPLKEAREQFMDVQRELAERGVISPNTVAARGSAVLHLINWYSEKKVVSKIQFSDVQKMFEARVREGYAIAGLHTYLSHLNVFFEWLGMSGLARAVTVPEKPYREARAWSDAELVTIREAADRLDLKTRWPIYRLAVELAVATGARQAELFAIDWGMIDEEEKVVRISRQLRRKKFALPKSTRPRTALILPSWWEHHREAKGLILTRRGEPMWSAEGRRHIVKALLQEAGLHESGLGWHTFRHTYGRIFIERGRFEELKESMGHKSILITEQVYGHFHTDRAAQLARMKIYAEAGPRIMR
jgi:integrase